MSSDEAAAKPREVSQMRPVMGTFMEVKVFMRDDSERGYRDDAAEKINDAFMVAGHLEKKLSIYAPESEVNVLNMKKSISASLELFEVMDLSLTASRITGGYFDITVAPILKENGFYKNIPEDMFNRIPDVYRPEGWKSIKLIPGSNDIYFNSDIWVDLSGIAKGYIVDTITSFLKGHNMDNFIVNAGGDIYATSKPGDEDLNIGIRDPANNDVLAVLSVRDKAVATSGDYENWLVEESTGEVIAHIVDPVSEEMVLKNLESVTVISSSCARSDSLATGMIAMGPGKALALADSIDGVEAIWISSEKGEHDILFSHGAEQYVTWRR